MSDISKLIITFCIHRFSVNGRDGRVRVLFLASGLSLLCNMTVILILVALAPYGRFSIYEKHEENKKDIDYKNVRAR